MRYPKTAGHKSALPFTMPPESQSHIPQSTDLLLGIILVNYTVAQGIVKARPELVAIITSNQFEIAFRGSDTPLREKAILVWLLKLVPRQCSNTSKTGIYGRPNTIDQGEKKLG